MPDDRKPFDWLPERDGSPRKDQCESCGHAIEAIPPVGSTESDLARYLRWRKEGGMLVMNTDVVHLLRRIDELEQVARGNNALVAAAYEASASVLGEDKRDEWPASAILDLMPTDARDARDRLLEDAHDRGRLERVDQRELEVQIDKKIDALAALALMSPPGVDCSPLMAEARAALAARLDQAHEMGRAEGVASRIVPTTPLPLASSEIERGMALARETKLREIAADPEMACRCKCGHTRAIHHGLYTSCRNEDDGGCPCNRFVAREERP